ncbi:MAG: hypothetical protein HDR12_06365 [Lachnospiraceae bacterium]|nr:hypothetical protein [Lachnospiraceae bacterium]
MKIKFKILYIILSIVLLFVSVFHFSFVTYASDYTGHGGGGHSSSSHEGRDKLTEEEKTEKKKAFINQFAFSIQYLACNVGAIVDHDFASILENYKVYDNTNWKEAWWKEENIEIDDYGCITVPDDMVSSIKQALREYSEETNGYWLIPTASIDALNPPDFYEKQAYVTLQNLINNHGIIACQLEGVLPSWGHGHDSFLAADFSEYISSEYNLVCWNTGYDPYTATDSMFIGIYDNNWEKYDIDKKYEWNHTIYSNVSSGSEFDRGGYNYFYPNYPKYNDGKLYICSSTLNSRYQYYGMLISKDGCRIRVFKSINAMKMFDAGKRTVYFGPGFYEKDPTNITITIDDFEKYLNGDLDDYFKRLQDTIISQGQNLSEADVEKLTDSILKELHNISGSLGDLNESSGETNNLLSKILAVLENLDRNVASILSSLDDKVTSTLDFSGIEERLDTIIMSLGIISGQLDDMTAEEIERKTDNALKEMQDEFSDIGELAKTKFPLSLPWDLGKAFDKISGGNITSGESPPESVAALLYDEPDKFVYTMSLYDDNGIALYASENTDSSQGGGYFPSMEFSVDSLRGTDNGGHISSGGQEHGGGGASRWGAWHSDTGAPIFYMPVEFSHNMKIGGMLIIDLSGFEVLHSIGRIMFSVIFCMNLVHLTFKAISAGKDLLTW